MAVALEHHHLVSRDPHAWVHPRSPVEEPASGRRPAACHGGPAVLARLRDITGESAQMFRRQGDTGCGGCRGRGVWPSRQRGAGGHPLTMNAGSAARCLLASEEPDRMQRGLAGQPLLGSGAAAVDVVAGLIQWVSGSQAWRRFRRPYVHPRGRSCVAVRLGSDRAIVSAARPAGRSP